MVLQSLFVYFACVQCYQKQLYDRKATDERYKVCGSTLWQFQEDIHPSSTNPGMDCTVWSLFCQMSHTGYSLLCSTIETIAAAIGKWYTSID